MPIVYIEKDLLINFDSLTQKEFNEFPNWCEYYDVEELIDLETWGYDKDNIQKVLAGAWKEMEDKNHHNHPSYNIIGKLEPKTRRFIYCKVKVRDESNNEFCGYLTYCGQRIASLNIFVDNEEAFFLYDADGDFDESCIEAFSLLYPRILPGEKIVFEIEVVQPLELIEGASKMELGFSLKE